MTLHKSSRKKAQKPQKRRMKNEQTADFTAHADKKQEKCLHIIGSKSISDFFLYSPFLRLIFILEIRAIRGSI
jgi:hypothetical protein